MNVIRHKLSNLFQVIMFSIIFVRGKILKFNKIKHYIKVIIVIKTDKQIDKSKSYKHFTVMSINQRIYKTDSYFSTIPSFKIEVWTNATSRARSAIKG